MSSVAARLEARAAEDASAAAASSSGSAARDNATIASENHAQRSAFLASFEAGRSQMERELAKLAAGRDADKTNASSSSSSGNADASAPLDPAAALRALSSSLSALHALSAASAHLLPAYELRSNKTALRELESALDHARAQAQPRGKFKFSRRAPTPAAAAAAAAKKAAEAANEATAAASAVPAAAVPASSASASAPEPLAEDARTGFYRHSNRVLVKLASSISGSDVTLADLSDCVVILLGSPTALRCSNLRRTHVFMGPSSGSVLIYGSVECSFHLAARQLRIHDAHATTFRIHAKSAPIIEHSDTSGFGSYDFNYPGMEQHWVASNLLVGLPSDGADSAAVQALSRAQSKHREVEDFNWLRAQHSPNWWTIDDDADKTNAGDKQAAAAATPASAIALPSFPPLLITPQQMESLRDMPDTAANDEQLQSTLATLLKEWRIR